jgi:hypothetical protein
LLQLQLIGEYLPWLSSSHGLESNAFLTDTSGELERVKGGRGGRRGARRGEKDIYIYRKIAERRGEERRGISLHKERDEGGRMREG